MKHSVKFTRTFSLFAHLSPHLGGANDSVKCLKIHFWRRFPNRKRWPYQQWGNEKFFKNDPKWTKFHHFSYIFFIFSATESIESYVFRTLWSHLGAEKWHISCILYLEISAFGAIPNRLLLTRLLAHIQLSIPDGQSEDSIKLTKHLPLTHTGSLTSPIQMILLCTSSSEGMWSCEHLVNFNSKWEPVLLACGCFAGPANFNSTVGENSWYPLLRWLNWFSDLLT